MDAGTRDADADNDDDVKELELNLTPVPSNDSDEHENKVSTKQTAYAVTTTMSDDETNIDTPVTNINGEKKNGDGVLSTISEKHKDTETQTKSETDKNSKESMFMKWSSNSLGRPARLSQTMSYTTNYHASINVQGLGSPPSNDTNNAGVDHDYSVTDSTAGMRNYKITPVPPALASPPTMMRSVSDGVTRRSTDDINDQNSSSSSRRQTNGSNCNSRGGSNGRLHKKKSTNVSDFVADVVGGFGDMMRSSSRVMMDD